MLESSKSHPVVGIDDISVYIPSLYLSIAELADARGIEPAKLEKGLGLLSMAVPDASEDVVTMAAEALIDLVEKNDLQPEDIAGYMWVPKIWSMPQSPLHPTFWVSWPGTTSKKVSMHEILVNAM